MTFAQYADFGQNRYRRRSYQEYVQKGAALGRRPDVVGKLENIKWYLRHGNVFSALQELEGLDFDIDCYEKDSAVVLKIGKATGDLRDTFRHDA